MNIVIALAAVAVGHAAPSFDLLATCPGEDCSRQMRVVWHSSSPSCELAYAPTDGSSRPAKVKTVKTRSPVVYTGQTNYWKYAATIDGLKPGSRYAYRVSADGAHSPAQQFKTAGGNGEFCFLWMGDIHSTPSKPKKMESVASLFGIAAEASASLGGIDFVLCTGDAVKHGQTYRCWREWNGSEPFAKCMMAAVCGNKEYYRDEGKARWHNRWFLAARNNPPNGADGLESTYWFIYNGVMFIGIDTLATEGREMDAAAVRAGRNGQFEWFERVAKAQRGRYRYLVAFQHYPYFTRKGPAGYGGYERWQPVFDRCGVDFALSGDSHSYVRSKRLRGGREDANGTVYVVCPEIDGHLGDADLREGEGSVAAYDAKSSSYGACWFSVGKDEMTMHWFCKDASDIDSVTVRAKRAAPSK